MLVLKRIFQNDKYTIGKLYLNDTYLCDTLEPPKYVNHPCIEKGNVQNRVSVFKQIRSKYAVPVEC